MNVSFEGIGENVATFEALESGAAQAVAGEAVTLYGNGTVCACTTEGDVPVGKAIAVRDGYASVQLTGYMELPCAGSLKAGFSRVSVNADGKLDADANGREALVVDVDAGRGVCGVIL